MGSFATFAVATLMVVGILATPALAHTGKKTPPPANALSPAPAPAPAHVVTPSPAPAKDGHYASPPYFAGGSEAPAPAPVSTSMGFPSVSAVRGPVAFLGAVVASAFLLL